MSDESEQNRRLKWARENAGYPQAKAAAEAFGWVSSTYSAHENGQNGLKVETARRYAAAFRVDLCWLLTGTGSPSGEPREIVVMWDKLSEPQRQRVVAFAEGMLADQPPPPVPQPPPAAPSNRVTPRFKEQPELPTIGQGGTVRYYLLDWMDHRNMEPEDLVKRLPDWDLADLKRVLAGRFEPPADLIHYAAKALRTTEERLREMPPPLPTKPARKETKRARRQ